jgi:hypothetical protein
MQRTIDGAVLLALGIWLSVLTGCTRNTGGPKLASSAEQPAYALGQPTELEHAHEDFNRQLEQATSTSSELSAFPDALGAKVDWKLVEQVYRKADEEGRASGYSQSYQEAATVQRFFTEEEKKVVGRTAGAAQHVAKEEGHELKLYGAVKYGLERGIDAQLKQRARARSDAHMLVSDNEETLGKDAATLHDQADKISAASHITSIALFYAEARMRQLHDEASAVRSTLQERKEALAKAEKPDPKKQAEVDQALTTLDSAQEATRTSLEHAKDQAKQVREAYEKALEELLDAVAKKPSP